MSIGQTNPHGVQQQNRGIGICLTGLAVREMPGESAMPAIFTVPKDGMPHLCQLDAYLVGTACQQTYLHQAALLSSGQTAHQTASLLAVGRKEGG